MKVLIGIHYFPPHVGGMENVAKQQAAKLAAAGHEVTVVTSAVDAPRGIEQKDNYTIRRLGVWNWFERTMGVPFPVFGPSLFIQGYRLVKTADIVHLHDVFYETSWVLAFWAWILRRPVVVTQHVDMIPHPSSLVRFVQKAVYRTAGRFVFSIAKRVAVLNSNVRAFLLKLGVSEQKLVFMPNGVDFTIFHPDRTVNRDEVRRRYALPLDQPIALFVGRFVPKKGFDKLMRATSETYHIALAGGGAPHGMSSDTSKTFLGARSPKELAELYNSVDMFVLPSEGEGFPLTVQEAMASQLPVVISHNPGYDIYELDSTLFEQITPTIPHIRDSLTKLATDSSLRARMAEYSHRYAREHFSWDTNIRQLQAIYEEVR